MPRFLTSLLILLSALCASAASDNVSEYIKSLDNILKSCDFNKELMTQISPYVKELDAALDDAPKYTREKDIRMAKLRSKIATSQKNLPTAFYYESELFEEYREYNYDSMFVCANRCLDIATRLKDRNKIAESRIKTARAFLLGGYFRECDNTIEQIDTTGCTINTKLHFLQIVFDMNFEDGFYVPVKVFATDPFDYEMNRIMKEISSIVPENSIQILDCKSKIEFHHRNSSEALLYYHKILKQTKPGSMDYANIIGGIGYNALANGDIVEAFRCMCQSAIIGIKHGSKAHHAMRKISEGMYIIGNMNKAYQYIQISMANAQFFNSRYRIYEASKIFPKLDHELYSAISRANNIKFWAIIWLAILLVMLVISIFFVIKQNKKLYSQKLIIASQNDTLQNNNVIIENANDALREANFIKDKTLGRIIANTASRNEQLDHIQKEVLRKLKVKSYDDIPAVIETIRRDNKSSIKSLDQMVLQIFPNFVNQFNSLLRPETKICPDADNLLNPELRIFALIRLGISKNDEIAKCLDYSVNTIKSYKTRIKNNAIINKDSFEQELMNIKFDDICRKS